MGGSSGRSRNLGNDELRELEEVAKTSIREGAQPQKRNLFISFVEEDLNEVNLLRGQAKNDNSNLEFNDWSLKEPFDSNNAEYIKRGIRERLRQCSVTICYITENTAKSEWVDWEIRESVKLGKGVVVMHKGDTPPKNLPPVVQELGINPIPWDHREISKAVEKAAQ